MRGTSTEGGKYTKIHVDKVAKPSTLGSAFGGDIKADTKYSNHTYKNTKCKEVDSFAITNHFCKLYRNQSFV